MLHCHFINSTIGAIQVSHVDDKGMVESFIVRRMNDEFDFGQVKFEIPVNFPF